jgi:hypothetical protein
MSFHPHEATACLEQNGLPQTPIVQEPGEYMLKQSLRKLMLKNRDGNSVFVFVLRNGIPMLQQYLSVTP